MLFRRSVILAASFVLVLWTTFAFFRTTATTKKLDQRPSTDAKAAADLPAHQPNISIDNAPIHAPGFDQAPEPTKAKRPRISKSALAVKSKVAVPSTPVITPIGTPPTPTPTSAPEITLDDLEKSIDLDQAQLMDWLNSEEGNLDLSVFGGSLAGNASMSFDPLTAWNTIRRFSEMANPNEYHYIKHETIMVQGLGTFNTRTRLPHFGHMARRVRSNLIAFQLLHDKPSFRDILDLDQNSSNSSMTLTLEGIVKNMTDGLFPWLPSPVREMQQKFLNATHQSGIAMTSGEKHFDYLIHAITALRTVQNCTLPIEVFYAGSKDLPQEMVQSLTAFKDVTTIDLTTIFPSEMKDFKKWSIKPFAMLASSFRNVIFVDADVLFFQSPEIILTESAIFKTYGQLFFHDRSMNRGDGLYKDWWRDVNPVMSRYSTSLRYANGLSWHEQESGVVAMDKGRSGVLFSLLFACKMNSRDTRKETFSHMWGDKETFWMSSDLARVPYQFSPGYSGAIGYKNGTMICGSNYHTDEHLRPFWWNGGIEMIKGRSKRMGFMKFEYAAVDLDRDTEKWEEETEKAPFCMQPADPEKEVVELGYLQQSAGAAYIQFFKDLRDKGWQRFLDPNWVAPAVDPKKSSLYGEEEEGGEKEGGEGDGVEWVLEQAEEGEAI
ncbi:hypothetical protein HDU98_012055 [Podochytrium sp. JEL0797]|nr:hypothetical protein HDU98_012055 [Podochytrium sp. JEL0797]